MCSGACATMEASNMDNMDSPSVTGLQDVYPINAAPQTEDDTPDGFYDNFQYHSELSLPGCRQ